MRVIASPPIVGAALLALDQLKADGAARARLRRELDAAVVRAGGNPDRRRCGQRWDSSQGRSPGEAAMAEIRFEQASVIYPGTEVRRGARSGPDRRRRRVDGPGRPVGLGQDAPRCGCSPGSRRSTAGTIFIGDEDVTDVAPKDRDVAMVFQNYALYPYLDVAANIAFPLKMTRVPKAERAAPRPRGGRAARTDRLSEPQAGAALGRTAATGCDGPSDRARAGLLPDG